MDQKIFSTNGNVFYCKVCDYSVKVTKRFLFLQHTQTAVHLKKLKNVEKGVNNPASIQLITNSINQQNSDESKKFKLKNFCILCIFYAYIRNISFAYMRIFKANFVHICPHPGYNC